MILLTQIIALSCFGMATTYMFTMTAFELRYGITKQQEGRLTFFTLLNQLSGKKMASFLAVLFTVVSVINWLSLITMVLAIIDYMALSAYFNPAELSGTNGAYFVASFMAGIIGAFGLEKMKGIFGTLADDDIIFVTEIILKINYLLMRGERRENLGINQPKK